MIFDETRKKLLVLTPEEWVRQHFVHFLIGKGVPKGLLALERGLSYNKLQKRSDILVYDHDGQPNMLVECKAPQITLDQSVLSQALTYNQTIKAKYIAITNGMQHAYWLWENGDIKMLDIEDIFADQP